jgi:hypothetical protein
MANSSRKTRQRAAAGSAAARQDPASSGRSPWVPARPRPPRPWLLALAAVLYGLWLILLLLLVALA